MKKYTSDTVRPTFETNCILSPITGPQQLMCVIKLPLYHGEQVVMAFLEGYAAAKGMTLAKVSMCVYNAKEQSFRDTHHAKWYKDCMGKLYFNQDQL